MKFITLICILILIIGCEKNPPKPDRYRVRIDNFFSGKHKLRSLSCFMSKEQKVTNSSSGFFVLIAGGYSSNGTSTVSDIKKARFSWLNSKGEYVLSSFPMSNIRFKIDNYVQEPYCKFRWRYERGNLGKDWLGPTNFNGGNWQTYVNYVVLVLREQDIHNPGIELNLEGI